MIQRAGELLDSDSLRRRAFQCSPAQSHAGATKDHYRASTALSRYPRHVTASGPKLNERVREVRTAREIEGAEDEEAGASQPRGLPITPEERLLPTQNRETLSLFRTYFVTFQLTTYRRTLNVALREARP